jgi:hypothetical protein
MYTDLNPFVWRWIFLAGFMAIVGVSLLLLAVGQWLQKRAQERRRAERAHRRSTHAGPIHAS